MSHVRPLCLNRDSRYGFVRGRSPRHWHTSITPPHDIQGQILRFAHGVRRSGLGSDSLVIGQGQRLAYAWDGRLKAYPTAGLVEPSPLRLGLDSAARRRGSEIWLRLPLTAMLCCHRRNGTLLRPPGGSSPPAKHGARSLNAMMPRCLDASVFDALAFGSRLNGNSAATSLRRRVRLGWRGCAVDRSWSAPRRPFGCWGTR